jgi:hypothetical protein
MLGPLALKQTGVFCRRSSITVPAASIGRIFSGWSPFDIPVTFTQERRKSDEQKKKRKPKLLSDRRSGFDVADGSFEFCSRSAFR